MTGHESIPLRMGIIPELLALPAISVFLDFRFGYTQKSPESHVEDMKHLNKVGRALIINYQSFYLL